MSFAWPAVLLLGVVLVPVTLRALLLGTRRREAELRAFGEPAVLERGSSLSDGRTARLRAWLQASALGLGVLALARPQLGERPAELARTGRDLLVVLDLSRSMTVTDVSPTRLAAAKDAVWEVVSASPGDRVGLVVFGGSAFLQLPLTSDHATFKLFLDAATPDDLGDPATDIGTALATAGKVFEHEGDRGHRAVLLASDGESDEGDLEAATASLRGEGIPVFALGVGTSGGGPVPADSSEAPEKFHRDHIGRVAISRLEENELRTAAKLTGGAYARAARADDRKALREALAEVRTRTLSTQQATEHADRFQWPLALAVIALLGEMWLAAPRTAPADTRASARACARGRRRAAAASAAPERRLRAGVARRQEGRAALRLGRLRRLGQGVRPRVGRGQHAGPGVQRGERLLSHEALRGRGRAVPLRGRTAPSSDSRASSTSATRSSARPRRHPSGANCCSTRSARTRRRCVWIRRTRTPSGTSSWRCSGWKRTA